MGMLFARLAACRSLRCGPWIYLILRSGKQAVTTQLFPMKTVNQAGSMNIHRAPVTESFCPLPNALLQDKALSFRARGILVMMLSMPLHWQTYHSWLTEQGKEGEEAVRTALRELESAGYLTKRQRREQGRMAGFQWDWYSVPVPVSERTCYRHQPGSGKTGSGSSGSGKTVTIKDSGEKKQKEKKESPKGRASPLSVPERERASKSLSGNLRL